MLVKHQIKVMGGDLGQTSKMPGLSFGLSTSECPVGKKLQDVCGSVCEGCYAKRLEAFRPSVQVGHDNRTRAVHEAMKTKEGQDLWVEAMVARIAKRLEGNYFRWHDSGDLQGMAHLNMIVRVARELPDVNFWLPTKEKKVVAEFLRKRIAPNNLMIRVSSAMVDAPPMKAFTYTSTVHKEHEPSGHVCPAPKQDGECGECRACWSKDVLNVSYKKH